MYVVVPQHGGSHVTMAQQQMGLVVAQVNVIHIMKVADGFVDDHRKLTDIKEVFQIRHAATCQETAQTHNNKWDLKNRRLAQASTLRQVHRRSSA